MTLLPPKSTRPYTLFPYSTLFRSANLTGYPDEPVKSYAPWVDFGTASLTAFGTMAALMERAKTGKGQIVEGALLSTALAYFNFHLIEQDLDRKSTRLNSSH